jgi:hypothetical protein
MLGLCVAVLHLAVGYQAGIIRVMAVDYDDWLPITCLAERAGVSQPCMSLRVKKYVAAGLLEPKTGLNGQKLISTAACDTLRALRAARRGAPTAGQKPIPKAPRPPAPIELVDGADPDRVESLHEAQRRKTSKQADMIAIALQERRGELLPVADVSDAMRRAAETITRSLEGYAARSAELVAAVLKDGEIGARRVAKAHTLAVRATIASEMRKLASPGL